MAVSNTDERERLIRELLARRGLTSARRSTTISRRPPDARIPLSPLQEGMWFLDRLDPGNSAYVLASTLRLSGPLNTTMLQAAVDTVVARHEALRTAIVLREGRAEQVVRDPAKCPVPVRVDDLTGQPAAGREARALEITRTEVETGFDLSQAPVVRVRLTRIDRHDHLLTVCLHHILGDDRSVGIVLNEILDHYHRLRSGTAPPDGPAPVQFSDYVLWRQSELDEAAVERQRRFWADRLTGMPGLLTLPTDRPRPRTQSFAGETFRFQLDADLSKAVEKLATTGRYTRFMILLTAMQVLLSRWSGQDDVCVGTPVSTRSAPELQSVVGLMVNSLPLRGDLSGDPTLAEALDRIRRTCVDSLDHPDLPLAHLVELVGLNRDLGHNPLFQTMCVVNPAGRQQRWDELTGHPLGVTRRTSRMDLTLMFFETAPELSGVVDYSTELFDRSTIERFVQRFTLVLGALIATPSRRLSEVDLRTTAESAEIAEWNRTDRDYPPATGLHELIRAQAAATPDAVAIVDGDTLLSYADLIRRAEYVARQLRTAGVGPDTPVGLALPASTAAIVGLVGILQAGGAYLPLDPSHPAGRLRGLLDDAKAPVTVTSVEHVDRLRELSGTLLVLDETGHPVQAGPPTLASAPAIDGPETTRCHPDQLAYVIYTSGSTGTPKGVGVAHRSAINLTRAFIDLHGITTTDRLLMLPPLSFDASVGDVFPALVSGATLVLHRRPAELTGPGLLQLCAEQRITLVDTAAALWIRWVADLDGALPAETPLRALMIGGEAAPATAAREWARITGGRAAIYNHYGPTEATVCATTYRTVDGAELANLTHLPIGRPVPNVQAHLLDTALRPVPIGMIGEVYLGGAAPARGYVGSPALTAQRFVPDPFGEPGARLYRTGDLARHRPDGTIEFLGRSDRQVKIRGHRIDLGEVEAACMALPEIAQAAVVTRDDGTGDRLVGYLVAAHEPAPSPAAVRAALRRHLPEYLVPSALVFLPELPLTAHGKLDEITLPAPPALASVERMPPRTATERKLAAIWAALLGGGPVGANDNFFDLGGHSLLAGPLIARVDTELGIDLQPRALFETTDLAELAALLDELRIGAAADRDRAANRPPLAAMMRADAELPDDICAHLPAQPPTADPAAVLITGATGFLGAHLLADWLANSDSELHCLVRAGSPETALARVRDNLRRYELWRDEYAHRLIGVPGDLGEPALGLLRRDFDALADRVDLVLHNGGAVNFLTPYEQLRPANVNGTIEAIRLAATGRPSALHLVSTLGVFLTSRRQGETVYEQDTPDDSDGLDGYNATKWVADAAAQAARDRGLAVSIYRPARISGHGTTGVGNADDYFSRLLKTFIQLGAVPEIVGDEADLTPVDHVAASIGYLARQPDQRGKDFHFYNNHTISFPGLAEALSGFGYPVRLQPYPEWRAALLARPDTALTPFASLFRAAAPRRTQPVFDCAATEKALAAAGLRCPPADAALIHTYLAWFVRVGHLDPPNVGRTGD
ncbi:MAG TPA: amino acid adenylation domain-containing protein [Micromonospora sp.]|nr:amino acid adenylation domain-containing protein [Micromonospora sp.]